jgi:1-phosphofructokinase
VCGGSGRLHERGVRVAIDTGGAGLPATFAAAPDLIKPNQRELAQASGMAVLDLAQALAAVHRIRAAGARTVLASLGADGALLVDGAGCPARMTLTATR